MTIDRVSSATTAAASSAAEASAPPAPPAARPDARVAWARNALARTAAPLLAELRRQSWFIALCLLYAAGAYGLARALGQPVSLGLYNRLHLAHFLAIAMAALTLHSGVLIARHRPARPLRLLWGELKSLDLSERLGAALPALMLLPVVLSAYTSLKQAIPTLAAFSWDARLAQLDAALHGGHQPWELLQPLLGKPAVTAWVDWAYGPPWFWMLAAILFWLTFARDARRPRLLATFVLAWLLLGNGLGTLLSSAGPVYYGRLVDGPDPFLPLLDYLERASDAHPLYAVLAQEHLWRSFGQGYLGAATGISAMPSLHVAMGFFFVLLCWAGPWPLRALALAYLALLLLGSVHLAWHYALDGYVAIAGVAVIWWATGRALRRTAIHAREEASRSA